MLISEATTPPHKMIHAPSGPARASVRMPRRPPTENGRQLASAARVVHSPPSYLLRIPLELRQTIYQYLVSDESSESLLQLLRVSQQMSKEARPFLFRRPLLFEGQAQLFQWLRMVRREDLHLVADLGFQLHDIKPDEIVGALGKRLRQANRDSSQSSRDNPYYEACELEVRRIGEAFSLMPGVKRLTVIPCTEADPRPSHRMMVQFSRMLSRCFPNLHTLFSREPALPITFVANKPKLRHLQVPSCGCDSPSEVSSVCSTAPLNKLAIYGGSRGRSPNSNNTEVVADILRAVRPLRELTLYESDVGSVSTDIAHELLVKSPDAIGKHLRTLRTLKVLIEYTHTIERAKSTMTQLQKFLEHSNIERLEVAEPLIGTLDDGLPTSLKTFVIRLDRLSRSEYDLGGRIQRLMRQFQSFTEYLKDEDSNELEDLRDVVLLLHPSEDDDEDNIEDISVLKHAERLFRGTGVNLRWMLAEAHESL